MDDEIVMKNKALPKIGQRAFSLVELLVVIAVIAIIAAIAIPNIANITGQAQIAKDQRNAQNVASVAAAARAAGATNSELGQAANVIAALQTGVSVNQPNGPALEFGISTMSAEEATRAAGYLANASTTNGAVVYNPAGSGGDADADDD